MKNKRIYFSDFSVSCLVKSLLKDLWMIVAVALICSMLTTLYREHTHVYRYQSSVTYSVTARRTSYTSSNNLTAAKEAAAVLAEMLRSSVVLDTLRSDAELQNFNGAIDAYQVTETNFIVITVTDDSPEEALLAIQSLTEIFPTFTAYLSGSVVQVIRNPSVSTTPINQVDIPAMARNAGLLGGAAMTALLVWLFICKDTIQTRTGARHQLDAPIVATICRERRRRLKKDTRPIQVFAPSTSFAYTEQINTICARLEQESASRGAKVFLVCGAGENEGKSTVAANVAAALALMGKKVALVDCDLRNPSLNRFFGNCYSAPIPVNKLLSQPITRDALLQCMQRHEKLGLFMLFPSGPDRRCSELLSGDHMDQLLRQLRVFDYVILDTPPMSFFADAEALAEKADGSLLVVRQDHTPACDINDTIDILRASGAGFLGCVLNDMTASVTEGYGGYGYGGYGYGYGYGHRYGYGYGGYGYGEHSGGRHGKSRTSSKKGG